MGAGCGKQSARTSILQAGVNKPVKALSFGIHKSIRAQPEEMVRSKVSDALENASKALEKSASFFRDQALRLDPWRSHNQLDKKLSALIPSLLNQKTFYVEAGANNGIRQSNTLFLEKRFGASGILIEPSQHLFEECGRNRNQKNIFEHCALVSESYEKPYMEFIYSDLMTVSLDVKDRDPIAHAREGLNHTRSQNYLFFSPARTLSSILTKHNVRHVDILSLDLEGYEIEALQGASLESGIIRNILVEHPNLDRMKDFLEGYSYSYVQSLSAQDHLFTLDPCKFLIN